MTEAAPKSDGGGGAELLRRAALGEPEAVDRWFRREHPAVFRLCAGFLADANEAEDVAQDAMLHLLDRLDRFDGARPWRTWRNALVLNLCRDRRRRRDARARAEDARAELASRQVLPDPASVVESAELRALVSGALAGLPPREREAFVLRDLEGLDTAEAAEALGVGPSTVRSLLTLARRRLRELLAPRLPDTVGGGHGGA
ncbi:MAG: sigma-70 family RNA polymerase sigma factor [Planctomycetota bacterium]